MKRFLFFILAVQIITSGNFIPEVVKFNNLVDHFIEHQSGTHPLGVLDFFKLHYFDSHHEQSDPIRHASLPLYQVSTSFVIAFHSVLDQLNFIPSFPVPSAQFNSFKKGLVPQCHQVSIFQPPRFV